MNRAALISVVAVLAVLVFSGCGNATTPIATDANGRPIEGMQVGYSAPDFNVLGLDGQYLSLNKFQGKAILINFWATWCEPCKTEIPDLVSVQNQFKDRLAIIGVDEQEGKAAVSDYATAYHMNYSIGLDGQGALAYTYGARGLPKSVFINTSGVITHTNVGALQFADIKNYVEEALKK